MKLHYFFILLILLDASCKLMPKNAGTNQQLVSVDDSLSVNQKFGRIRMLTLGPDSNDYRAAAAKLMLTMIYTQKDTSAYIQQLAHDTSGYFAGYEKLEKMKREDTSVFNFYKELLHIREEFPVIVSGKYQLLDKDNPFTIGFERILNADTILIIMNMDEDNQGFRGHFPYGKMRQVLSNYEDGPLPQIENSLAMRPFELWVSKL